MEQFEASFNGSGLSGEGSPLGSVGRTIPQQQKKLSLTVAKEMSFGLVDGNPYAGRRSPMLNMFDAGNSKGYEMQGIKITNQELGPSPTLKRKKEFILMRKQYVDKDGVLIQDKTDLIKEKSKLKLIHGLDLAHMKSDDVYEPAGFRPASPLSPPLGKKQSMEVRDNNDMVEDKIRKVQPSREAQFMLPGRGQSDGRSLIDPASKKTLGKKGQTVSSHIQNHKLLSVESAAAPGRALKFANKYDNKFLTGILKHQQTLDTDVEAFLEPKKDPYRKQSPAEGSAGSPQRNQMKKDPKTGEFINRAIIGDQKTIDEAETIKQNRLRKEKDSQRGMRRQGTFLVQSKLDNRIRKTLMPSQCGSKTSPSRALTQEIRQATITQQDPQSGDTRWNTATGDRSEAASNKSTFAKLKLNFRNKTKTKNTSQIQREQCISDGRYKDLCFDVTQRILTNQKKEKAIYQMLFTRTTTNKQRKGSIYFEQDMVERTDLQTNAQSPKSPVSYTESGRLLNDRGLNKFIQPTPFLEERLKINHRQLEKSKSGIASITRPAKSGFPQSLQMKETKDQRCISNYHKYQNVWSKYENKVEQHFERQYEIQTGKLMEDPETIKKHAFEKIQKLMAGGEILAEFKKAMGAPRTESGFTSDLGERTDHQSAAYSPESMKRSPSNLSFKDETNFFRDQGPDSKAETNTILISENQAQGNYGGKEAYFEDSQLLSNLSLEQMPLRARRVSVIHQGDIYNERRLEREALKQATLDAKQNMPAQMWYDSLRATDDGRFSSIKLQNAQVRLKSSNQSRREQYIKKKILGPSNEGGADAPVGQSIREQIGKHKSMQGFPIKAGHSRNQQVRPFNSTQRSYFQPIKGAPASNIYVRTTIFPKQEREGGLTGEEEYLETLKAQSSVVNLGGGAKPRYESNKRASLITQTSKQEDLRSSKNEQKLLDRRNTKVDMSTEVFGKPNVLIRNNPQFQSQNITQSVFDNYDSVIDRQHGHETMNATDFQNLLQRLDDPLNETAQSSTMFSRTRFSEQQYATNISKLYSTAKASEAPDFRILQKIDSAAREESYLNQTKTLNQSKLKKVMGGMNDIKDLCFLQVRGQSQLAKEIVETNNVKNKVLDIEALHRNEETHEMEGMDQEGASFDKVQKQPSTIEAIDSPPRQQLRDKFKSMNLSVGSLSDQGSQGASARTHAMKNARSRSIPRRVDYKKMQIHEVLAYHMDGEQLF